MDRITLRNADLSELYNECNDKQKEFIKKEVIKLSGLFTLDNCNLTQDSIVSLNSFFCNQELSGSDRDKLYLKLKDLIMSTFYYEPATGQYIPKYT